MTTAGMEHLRREITAACREAAELSEARLREPEKITKGKVRLALQRAFILAEAHMYAEGEWDTLKDTHAADRPMPYQIATYADTLNIHLGEIAVKIREELKRP